MSTFSTILLFIATALVCRADAAAYDSTVEPIAALLKPLTLIARTNLLLNLPYKWHDLTNQGCFATKIGDGSTIWVVCNEEDQKYYDTDDSSWILERTEGSESTDEYYGTIKMRNLGSREVVVRYAPPFKIVSLFNEQLLLSKWVAIADPSDKNNIAIELSNSNYWLSKAAKEQPHRYSLLLKTGKAPNFPYAFVAQMKLSANMYSFEFTEPPSGAIEAATSQKDLIDSYDIHNNSPATLTGEIKVSEKITNEFSWGLSESLKIFAKVTGKAGIPFLASTEVETGFEFDVSSNQNWKSSEEKTFEMSYRANVPPYSTIKISAWYDLTKDISMDYTSETEITGKGSRITVYDDVVDDSPATGEMIREYLEYIKFDGTVVQIKENSVITRIKGTMVASLGLRGQLNVDGEVLVWSFKLV